MSAPTPAERKAIDALLAGELPAENRGPEDAVTAALAEAYLEEER